MMLLGVLVFQNTFTVLLARYTRTVYVYEISHMLVSAEAIKFLLSFLLEQYTTGNVLKSLKEHNYETPYNAAMLSVPALLYFCSNTLVYVAISNLAVPLFQIVSQTKLATTAILSVLLLKRSYSWTQWGSILALCAGVTVCILGQQMANKEDIGDEAHVAVSSVSIYGLTTLAISNICGSLAGVYFEKVIKKIPAADDSAAPPSLWMRNMQLAFFTILINTVQEIIAAKSGNHFFDGFAPLVWLQICFFAVGGLLVASVVKYTDSVQKGLATGVSVILSSVLSSLTEHTNDAFTLPFAVGSTLAIGGCFCFSNAEAASGCLRRVVSKRRTVMLVIGAVLVIRCMAQSLRMVDSVFTQPLQMFESVSTLPKPSVNNEYGDLPYTNFTDMKNEMHFHIFGYSPAPSDCGGCKALVELLESLRDAGFSTAMRGMRCPTEADVLHLMATNKTLVIVYPEIMRQRCQGPNNTVHVRWMLAPMGVISPGTGDKSISRHWGLDDVVFNYATSTGDNISISNILQVFPNPREGDVTDISDEDFYNSTGRNGTVWLMRKGRKFHKQIDFIHDHDGLKATEVDPKKKPFSPELLRNYEYFVTYDPYTFWSWYAAMLGTVSVVYPLANLTKAEWALGTFVGSYLEDVGLTEIPGVAYGWTDSELQYARQTMHDLRGLLVDARQWGVDTTVTRFTRDCYRYGQGVREHFEGAMLFRDAYADYIANDYSFPP
jgi:UDP-sugar transporter A1/2/3